MTSSTYHVARRQPLLEMVLFGFAVMIGVGFVYATRFEDFLAYSVVLLAAIAPIALWLRSGAGGIPIFPTCAGLYWLYYGLPALRGVGEQSGYSPAHVLDADVTVALFLFVATLVWSQFLRPRRSGNLALPSNNAMNRRAVTYLVMIGFGMGLAFYLLIYSSFVGILGSALGVIRAVLLAPLLLACYLLGYGKAKGMFSSGQWIMALVILAITLMLQVGGLQLISGITELAAALAGYVYTARRIPWVAALIVGGLISVLQAGKAEIRDQYANVNVSAVATPALVSKWFVMGFDAITKNTHHASVSDRASLLPQMIRVQAWTPERVPYMNGESYTYLPAMLVPRIINPNRASTQVVMNLLDVRYGFLTQHETKSTAVGINIVPEAFANFGYAGVVIIGIILGLFSGYFTRISIGEEATSLPALFSIAAMVTLINMEADMSYMLATFFQAAIAVSVFYFGLRYVFDMKPVQPATGNI